MKIKFLEEIFNTLSEQTTNSIDDLLDIRKIENFKTNMEIPSENIKLRHLKQGQPGTKIIAVKNELAKLTRINKTNLNAKIFSSINRKLLLKYYDRIMREQLHSVKKHS